MGSNTIKNESIHLNSCHHNHQKQKDSLERRVVLLNLKYLGCPYREYVKTEKNCGFYEELLSENDFEAVLAHFCCYDYGVNASEAVRKIATDQEDFHKLSLCVIVC